VGTHQIGLRALWGQANDLFPKALTVQRIVGVGVETMHDT
jgi:hypothetical protein